MISQDGRLREWECLLAQCDTWTFSIKNANAHLHARLAMARFRPEQDERRELRTPDALSAFGLLRSFAAFAADQPRESRTSLTRG